MIGAFFIKGKNTDDGPRSLFGYSVFLVLTSSMEDTLPKNSFVITKNVKTDTLNIGDDITYLYQKGTTITHRIVEITELDNKTGTRSFRTKGTMNEQMDRETVYPQNIVGKVIYHNYKLGYAIKLIGENWYVVVTLIILGVGLYRSLCIIGTKTEKKEKGM